MPLPSKDPQPGSVEYEWLENLKMLRTNFKKSAYYYAVKEPQEMCTMHYNNNLVWQNLMMAI